LIPVVLSRKTNFAKLAILSVEMRKKSSSCGNSFPPCFDDQYDFDAWNSANELCSVKSAAESYCTDCLPAFAAEMRDESRCLHPETRFFLVALDEIVGSRYLTEPLREGFEIVETVFYGQD
jgi:hypothetical protein